MDEPNDLITITDNEIDVSSIIDSVKHESCGAISTFMGQWTFMRQLHRPFKIYTESLNLKFIILEKKVLYFYDYKFLIHVMNILNKR